MSNRLIRAARQVEAVSLPRGSRPIFPSEAAVLVALADDARDGDGGRSRLGAGEIAWRTKFSLRSVRSALSILQAAGLISREPGPSGTVSTTLVHPAVARVQPLHGTRAAIARDPCSHCTGPIESPDSTIIPGTSAGAREPGGLDEVGQVFAEWDRVAAARGLPGPVRRTERRCAAVRDKLAQDKLWRVLAAVRKVGESDFLRGRLRPPGQGDWRADFDQIFETTPAFKAKAIWDRLLEGSFGGGPVPVVEPPLISATTNVAAKTVVPPEFARLAALIDATWRPFTRLAWHGDELVVTCSNAAVAQFVSQMSGSALGDAARAERGPLAVAVIGCREPAGASP